MSQDKGFIHTVCHWLPLTGNRQRLNVIFVVDSCVCLLVCFRHWRNTALWLTARHLFEFTEQLWLKWNLPVYLTCMLIPCIPNYIPFSYILCGICFVYTKPYVIIIIYISVPVSLSLSPVWLPRGLILQDLTFVHLGNPDTLMTSQGSKVNFSKRWQQFNILDTLRSYQQVSVSEATLSAIPAGQSVCVSTHCVTSLSLQSILSAAKWWHHILLQRFQRSPGRGSIVGTFSQAPPTKCSTIHSELNKLKAKQGLCAHQNLQKAWILIPLYYRLFRPKSCWSWWQEHKGQISIVHCEKCWIQKN